MTPKVIVVTALPGTGGAIAIGAAVAVVATSLEIVRRRGGVVVAELDRRQRRGPTLLASVAARRLEGTLRSAGMAAAARGAVCWMNPGAAGGEPLEELVTLLRSSDGEAGAVVACLPASRWRAALEDERLPISGGLLVARLPAQRALAALAVRELRAAGVRAKVLGKRPGAVAGRRAVAGLDPGGPTAAHARRLATALLGPRPARPLLSVPDANPAPSPGPSDPVEAA
jgi:hypothetical protein